LDGHFWALLLVFPDEDFKVSAPFLMLQD